MQPFNYFKVIFTLFVFSCSVFAQSPSIQFTQKWETEPVLKVPESVIYDTKNKVLYVSNINGKPADRDTNGFISVLNIDGKIQNLNWVKGLHAPKGMGIFNNKLYVSDLTEVVIIDIAKGVIESKISITGAAFLNDISIDEKGNVYITDTGLAKIYMYDGKTAQVFVEGLPFMKPNGALARKNDLLILDMETRNIYSVDYKSKKINSIGKGIPSGDGLAAISDSEWFASNWFGEIFFVKDGNSELVKSTIKENKSSADIWVIGDQNLLFVPTFFANTVICYTFKK
ncbi:MAG: ATP/GTP-binding protein [Bacteroidota bacterium]|nr:ATP/GTP-binding protein [Bacteroidota bacterium]